MRNADARRFGLIVFDWDGTLADSTAIIASAIQRACADVGQPVPDEALAAIRHRVGIRRRGSARCAGSLRENYARLAAAYRDHYRAREFEISLFDGVRDLLDELSSAGYRLAIATGKSRAGFERALHKAALPACSMRLAAPTRRCPSRTPTCSSTSWRFSKRHRRGR